MSRPAWEPRQHGPSSPRPRWRGHTVAAAVDGALVKDHDVLGEGARLVGEDVLHLAQLLVQGGGAGLGGRPLLHAEHLLVPVDEVAVAQADDLHTAQRTGGEAVGGKGSRAHPHGPSLQALRRGRDEKERSGHLGRGGWRGEPAGGACHARPAKGVPYPDPLKPSRQKGAKGLGRRDRRHRQRRTDCGQGTRPVLTSGLIIQKPCREKRESARGKKEKKREREIMRVLHGPQHHRRPAGRGNRGSPGAPASLPEPKLPSSGLHKPTWGAQGAGGAH